MPKLISDPERSKCGPSGAHWIGWIGRVQWGNPIGALEELDIGSNDLDMEAARALAEAPTLRAMKVLEMDSVRSNAFDVLARAPWMDSIRILHCDTVGLPAMLARAPGHLHTLKVSGASGSMRLVDALASAPRVPSLRAIHLDDPSVDLEGMDRIVDGAVFRIWR